MVWALSMGMIRSRESEFGRASSAPTSIRHRATGSKRIRQTRARPGRLTGCRTSNEVADRGDRHCNAFFVAGTKYVASFVKKGSESQGITTTYIASTSRVASLWPRLPTSSWLAIVFDTRKCFLIGPISISPRQSPAPSRSSLMQACWRDSAATTTTQLPRFLEPLVLDIA